MSSRRSDSPLHRHGWRKALLTGVIFLLASPVLAQIQSVTPNPTMQVAGPGTQADIAFLYDNDLGDPETTGIGVRVHFDSAKLVLTEVRSVFSGDATTIVVGPSSVEDDLGDEDGDDATDKLFRVGWADIDAAFPGSVPPQLLFEASFTTAADFAGTTTVRITAIDTATGFGFASTPATISSTAPTPTATPTATPGPTPTATPMPTVTPTPTPVGVPVLDVDGNDTTTALTDGILVLRWLFGFTGEGLVNGAVDTDNCTRCTTEAIDAYLQSIEDQLDVDGDEDAQALSDGLLVLRWLFGFMDEALTDGAVDAGCTRCTAEAIDAYLEGLT